MQICAALGVALAALSGCNSPAPSGLISVVGAENQYTDVLQEIGGKYVSATSILSNPNADPHSFEVSTQVAQSVSGAALIVQNGLGYDAFMNSLESASSGSSRTVIVAQRLEHFSNSSNPHLWYEPTMMESVARVVASDLSALQPHHAAYFAANLRHFESSLVAWHQMIASFRSTHHDVQVATTEPVGNYLFNALGISVATPLQFQANIMNGIDPAVQDIVLVQSSLVGRHVSAFCYNQQVVDAITTSLRALAVTSHVPVVAFYETMPARYHYASWMIAETKAIINAVVEGHSTPRL